MYFCNAIRHCNGQSTSVVVGVGSVVYAISYGV